MSVPNIAKRALRLIPCSNAAPPSTSCRQQRQGQDAFSIRQNPTVAARLHVCPIEIAGWHNKG
eukprot:225858-Rhodomonas_salina.2